MFYESASVFYHSFWDLLRLQMIECCCLLVTTEGVKVLYSAVHNALLPSMSDCEAFWEVQDILTNIFVAWPVLFKLVLCTDMGCCWYCLSFSFNERGGSLERRTKHSYSDCLFYFFSNQVNLLPSFITPAGDPMCQLLHSHIDMYKF